MKTQLAGETDMNELPDTARAWVYQSSRELTDTEVDQIEAKVASFISEWAAHGNKLFGAFEIRYNRFIALFLNEQLAAASGCSIDTQLRFIQELERTHNLTLLDRMAIGYRDEDGTIKSLPMRDFEEALKNGKLNERTVVFNNLVPNLGSFKTHWEVPVLQSWHAKLLP